MTASRTTELSRTAAIVHRSSRVIPIEDEVELTWFFGPAVCRFSRSNCGAMTDRLDLLSYGSKPCGICDGTGVRWDYVAQIDEWTDTDDARHREVSWIDPDTGKRHDRNECERCRGTGAEPASKTRLRPSRSGYHRCHGCHGTGTNQVMGNACTWCRGQGYRVAPSAFAVHGPGGATGVVVDEDTLQRSAVVSRRLTAATLACPFSRSVLAGLYGDEGLRWASQGRRLMAVYHLTPAGNRLARGARSTRAIRSALEAAMTASDDVTKVLIAHAGVQAQELLDQTTEAWCACR